MRTVCTRQRPPTTNNTKFRLPLSASLLVARVAAAAVVVVFNVQDTMAALFLAVARVSRTLVAVHPLSHGSKHP